MIYRLMQNISLCITGVLVSSSCLAANMPQPKLPVTPPVFYEAARARTADESNKIKTNAPDRWWAIFNDPILDALIIRAEAGNSDIQLAVARLSQGINS